MDIADGSAPRADESLTDDDQRALEAIRRQLDTEFAHFSEPAPVVAERPAPRRRRRAGTVLGLLLAAVACCGAMAVFITVFYAFETPPAAERHASPAAPAQSPVMPATQRVAATRAVTVPPPAAPAEAAKEAPAPPVAATTEPAPAPRAEARTEPAPQRQASTPAPAPDVMRQTQARSTDAVPAAFIGAPSAAAPPAVQHTANVAPAPSTPAPPAERPVAAQPPVPLVQAATEQMRSAWISIKERVTSNVKEHVSPEQFRAAWKSVEDAVKERVKRPTGEIGQGRKMGPEAP